MCRSNLFFFSSAAAVLLLGLGLGLDSSSSAEAAVLRRGITGSSGRKIVRKTTKAGRAHYRNGQRDLQSGKGKGKGKGKGSSSNVDADSIFPSGMIATIEAIDSMNQEIIQHQINPQKSSKGSSSGDTYSDNTNYVDVGSTPDPTDDPPAITTPAVIQPNQGDSTKEIFSGVGADSDGAASDNGTPTEVEDDGPTSPLDTILESVVSVVGGVGESAANDATHQDESNTDPDGMADTSKDDIDTNEDQDAISTSSAPTDFAGADRDAISTPSAPTDPSTDTDVGDSSSTEGPASPSNPSIPPTTTDPSAGTIVGDSTSTEGPASPTIEIIPPTSGTTDESFLDGSTTTSPGYQQDDQQEDDEQHVSTDEFINLDDLDVGNSNVADGADTEDIDDAVVIIMPTPDTGTIGHTDEGNDASSDLPDFEYGGTINNYSPNQGKDKKEDGKPGEGNMEEEDHLNVHDAVDFIADDNIIDETSETGKDGKKDKNKPAKGGEEFEAEDKYEVNTDLNADVELVTPVGSQDPIAESILDEEEQSDNIAPESSTPGDGQEGIPEPNADGSDIQDTSTEDDKKDKDKPAKGGEEFEAEDNHEANQDPIAESILDEEEQSDNIAPESSTPGDDQEGIPEPNADGSDIQDTSTDAGTNSDVPQKEATNDNIITIPPLSTDESAPSDTEAETEASLSLNDEAEINADDSDIQDASTDAGTNSDVPQKEATNDNIITIPPLGTDESAPSDTEAETEASLPLNDEDLPSSSAGNDKNEYEDEDGDIRRLEMPQGLVVSLFLSEAETRRLQGSPTDPLKNQEDFEFVLNGLAETEFTLQNYLARHLNGYLIEGISGLSFVSIDSISAFLTTKSYQGRPTPAVVIKSIEGIATYQGVETPSPRIFEANTLGAFNSGEGRTALIGNLRDSNDNILSRIIDVSAEINRGSISPSSDTTNPIANAVTQSDTNLRADSGNAAKMSGIAIGGVIIIVALFVVGHKLTHRSKDETEFDDENSLEHKYDLDSIESETAFSSTLVSYHGGNSSRETDIALHHRNIMAYEDGSSYLEGTLVLSPVAEKPIAEEMIDDLMIAKKIQIIAEEPQKEAKVPSPLLRKIYSFSPSSLKRAILDNGLKKEMVAASILGSGNLAYDMSIISLSTSDDSNETPQEQSPCGDAGSSALLSKGPDPPAAADLNETADTSRAVMLYSYSESSGEGEDQSVPSTVDVDAVDSNEAAKRLGLGIRSFGDVKEEDEDEENRIIKSSPKPVATPERRVRLSPTEMSVESEQQSVWRQQKSQAGIAYDSRSPMTTSNNTLNQKGEENKLYDPIFVNGRVQMKERSPPYRQIFRK